MHWTYASNTECEHCHPFPSPPLSLLAVQGHWVREEQQAVVGLLGMWGGSQRPHLSSEGCVVCH